MIDGLIADRLIGDSQRRQGKGEGAYVVARVRALGLIAHRVLSTEPGV